MKNEFRPLLKKNMTAREIIQTVELLDAVTTELLDRLKRAVLQHEEQYRRVAIPEELLQAAGIPKGVLLDICAGDGEIYITIAEEEPKEIPSFLRELFEDCELDFGALRCLLESEEPICE